MTDHTRWVPEHFVGGHPALDLANAVYDRREPPPDNELLKSAKDVGGWLHAAGLAGEPAATAVGRIKAPHFLSDVRALREASFEVFDAVARGGDTPSEPLALLFSTAAGGAEHQLVSWSGTRPRLAAAHWHDPALVASFLAALAVEAFFTLPRPRVHACPRCGWLFADTSRGGKRRWCNMRVCGNREKMSRHRA